jgi:hypothetical protein
VRHALERHARRHHPIIIGYRSVGHCEWIAGADDQIVPAAKGNAPEYQARRQQHLTKTLVLATWPVRVIDFKFRPKMLQ